MSGADWGILLIVLISALTAASQGFFVEVFSLAGVVVGYLLAAWEFRHVAAWFAPYVSSPWVANVAGFLTIFIATTVLASAAGRVMRWTAKEVGFRWFDRMLGAAFGVVRGLAVVSVIALAVASFSPQSPLLANSRFAPYLLVVGRGAIWLAPTQVRQGFRAGVDGLHNLHAGDSGKDSRDIKAGSSGAPATAAPAGN